MAKLLNTLLVLFLFSLVVSNEITAVEGKLCEKRSKTWTGICVKTQSCNNQCKNRESASSGSCHRQGFGFACFCYFKC